MVALFAVAGFGLCSIDGLINRTVVGRLGKTLVYFSFDRRHGHTEGLVGLDECAALDLDGEDLVATQYISFTYLVLRHSRVAQRLASSSKPTS